MRLKDIGVVGLVASVLVIGSFQQRLLAQSHGSSTRDGIYTEEQAQQGKAIYTKQCAMCHGEALQGVGSSVALKGSVFLKDWTGQRMANLFMKTITAMPAINPGSLTPAQTAQVLAYILSENKFEPGTTKLSTNFRALEAIRISNP